MSKAFTKDDDAPEPELVPPRAPLPPGVPNYVTPRGLRLLREEMAALEAQRASAEASATDAALRRRALAPIAARMQQLGERLGSAVVVPAAEEPPEIARFGATVAVRAEDGEERSYRIVGVDEAAPAAGDIAFTSPIARALLGKAPGDEAVVETPRGRMTLEVLAIR